METRPTVWFVDDLQVNLDAFRAAHQDAFQIETFLSPQQVLDRLESSQPDALLCDIFFYDTPEQAQDIERQMTEQATRLREFARDIGADRDSYMAGIRLIEQVYGKYQGEPPFPSYAYTSKGPYLLDTEALNRLSSARAPLLLKGRLGRDRERLEIIADIEIHRDRQSIRGRIYRNLLPVMIGWSFVSWTIGRLLEQLWRHFTG